MSKLQRTILSITEPTIKVDKLSIEDVESNENISSIEKPTAIIGDIMPYIIINKFQITITDLIYFNLSTEGFIPEINIEFRDTTEKFHDLYYPKDGDVISILLKSRDKKSFKPIRCDFDIVNIKGDQSKTFTITGILKVPGLYSEICKSYKDKTSFDVLNDVADELKLGYASNDISTSDKMTWINPYDNRKKFIQDVTSASFKNDKSFYNSFIDLYYYLNFVNINTQYSEEVSDEMSVFYGLNSNELSRGNSDEDVNKFPLVLSNHPSLGDTSNHIKNYVLNNNTGEVWIQNGYRRYSQFFNATDKKFHSFLVDPLITEGSETSFQILKGRPGDTTYKDHKKYKYVGYLDEDNCHSNYHHAIILNNQNINEIDKMLLEVYIPIANFHFYRNQRIPVLIYETNEEKILELENRDTNVNEKGPESHNDEKTLYLNKLITGFYVIKSIHYVWMRGDTNISQKLVLSKREWGLQFKKNES